jgi:hypothetical protein
LLIFFPALIWIFSAHQKARQRWAPAGFGFLSISLAVYIRPWQSAGMDFP